MERMLLTFADCRIVGARVQISVCFKSKFVGNGSLGVFFRGKLRIDDGEEYPDEDSGEGEGEADEDSGEGEGEAEEYPDDGDEYPDDGDEYPDDDDEYPDDGDGDRETDLRDGFRPFWVYNRVSSRLRFVGNQSLGL